MCVLPTRPHITLHPRSTQPPQSPADSPQQPTPCPHDSPFPSPILPEDTFTSSPPLGPGPPMVIITCTVSTSTRLHTDVPQLHTSTSHPPGALHIGPRLPWALGVPAAPTHSLYHPKRSRIDRDWVGYKKSLREVLLGPVGLGPGVAPHSLLLCALVSSPVQQTDDAQGAWVCLPPNSMPSSHCPLAEADLEPPLPPQLPAVSPPTPLAPLLPHPCFSLPSHLTLAVTRVSTSMGAQSTPSSLNP